jgi:hypothetical protein
MTDTIVMKWDWGYGSKMVWYVTKDGICYCRNKHDTRTKESVARFFNFKVRESLTINGVSTLYFNPNAYRRIKS